MRELALFAGAGGGILGGTLLGWRTVCAVEIDAYCASVLAQRQNDQILPPFPIWDDVCTFDGRPWRGLVDVVSGGFPCQDISSMGKGAGISGERSGLWSEMARIIGEVRPCFVFVENSPMLVIRGLDRVLGDLSSMGYDAQWGVVGAHHVGAPHKRDRIWIVADADNSRCMSEADKWTKYIINNRKKVQSFVKPNSQTLADAASKPKSEFQRFWAKTPRGCWWATEPDVGRMVDGVAARMDRLKAIGNGQVPAVAAKAWGLLTGGRT